MLRFIRYWAICKKDPFQEFCAAGSLKKQQQKTTLRSWQSGRVSGIGLARLRDPVLAPGDAQLHIRSKNISSKGGKCFKKRKMVVKMMLSKN